MAGVYLLTATRANLLAHLFFGRVAAYWGNRRVMLAGVWAGLAMTGLALGLVALAEPLRLTGADASRWLLPVFVLSGIRESALGVAGQSLLLDITPAQDRSLYLGFTNTWLGLVLLATGLSGVVVAQFGLLTLIGVTLLAGGLALAAIWHMPDVVHRAAPLPEGAGTPVPSGD